MLLPARSSSIMAGRTPQKVCILHPTLNSVVWFTDKDSHNDVLKKGANGLGLKCNLDLLQLLCSGV